MEKINTILSKSLNISEEDAAKNLSMDEVSSWDSLSHMNLIVAIEEELNIELSGDDIADMTTCDAIRNTVAKYLN